MCEVVCTTCFHHCRLQEGQTGLCRARQNIGGESRSVNYGKVTALALDPIEKKPLAMFFPGANILSVGSFGCNLACPFCQNAAIACAGQTETRWEEIGPEELAQRAEQLKSRGNIGAAFTYNEPMIGWEYVRDAAMAVHRRGMQNVVVTNGAVCRDALLAVLPYIDAFNIDLKGFTEAWYHKLGGDLATVLAFIEQAAKSAHVELTALIVPGENDSPENMQHICRWIAEVDPNIPLHITRYFPRHNLTDRPPTPLFLLRRLYDTAKETLPHVFLGNV